MPNAFCLRCRGMAYITKTKADGGVTIDHLVVEEDVRLCGNCRAKAKVENDTAMYREGLENPK